MDRLSEVATSVIGAVWYDHDQLCHRIEDELFYFNPFEGFISRSKEGRTIDEIKEDFMCSRTKLGMQFQWLEETLGVHKSHMMEEVVRGKNSMSIRATRVHFKVLEMRFKVVEAQ